MERNKNNKKSYGRNLFFALAICVAPIAFAAPAESGAKDEVPIYRYKNSEGRVEISRQGVPTDYIEKGYEILSQSGRVIKVVPAMPDLSERKRMVEDEANKVADIQLLRLYSDTQQIDEAQQQKDIVLKSQIDASGKILEVAKSQLERFQNEAAAIEKNGGEVPQHLLVNISNVKTEIDSTEAQIRAYEGQREKELRFYQTQKDRFKYLKNRG